MAHLLGAHVSISKGFVGAIKEATDCGATAFALFTCSGRTWKKKPLDSNECESFKKALAEKGFSPDSIIPHGSYIINLGGSDAEKLKRSRDGFVDEVKRCEKLGLTRYNFHPGSITGNVSVKEACQGVADGINLALQQTTGVMVVIENTAGQGKTLGGTFEQLKMIIDGVSDQSRIGVCLDTCHLFASGIDIRTKEGWNGMMTDFDAKVGLKYLVAIHLNDSKSNLNSKLDRHESIGHGKIGAGCFKVIMNDERLLKVPIILETEGPFAPEIKFLRALVGDGPIPALPPKVEKKKKGKKEEDEDDEEDSEKKTKKKAATKKKAPAKKANKKRAKEEEDDDSESEMEEEEPKKKKTTKKAAPKRAAKKAKKEESSESEESD